MRKFTLKIKFTCPEDTNRCLTPPQNLKRKSIWKRCSRPRKFKLKSLKSINFVHTRMANMKRNGNTRSWQRFGTVFIWNKHPLKTKMFTVALFIIVSSWEQPKCQTSTLERIDHNVCVILPRKEECEITDNYQQHGWISEILLSNRSHTHILYNSMKFKT